MDKCSKVSLLLLYIVALALASLAIVLPFWVSIEVDEGVQELQVYKEIDSGLWWKYERFTVQSCFFTQSDKWWHRIAGTYLYTDSVQTVTGLMLFGLSALTFSFICTLCIPYFCLRNSRGIKNRRGIAVIGVGAIYLAVGFIASGPVIYYMHVLDEYGIGRDKDHLGSSFWLAVASTAVTFLTAVYSCYLSCRKRRTEFS